MSNPMLRLSNFFSLFVFLFFLALSLRAQAPEKQLLKNIPKNNNHLSAFSLPEQDCENAILLRHNFYSNIISYAGIGYRQDVGPSTCLVGGESNSVWYRFHIHQSGTLGFMIETQVDYDFALYDLTNHSCDRLPELTPIRCNFSDRAGNTGLDPTSIYQDNLSHNASDSPIMPGLNVVAGQTYYLMVNNWSASSPGFGIRFIGTCSIQPGPPPVAERILAPLCFPRDSVAQIAVEFNAPLRCLPNLNLENFRIRNSENQNCPIQSAFCLNQVGKGILRFAVRLLPTQDDEYFFSYMPQSASDSLYGESGGAIQPFTNGFRVKPPLQAPQLDWDAAALPCKNQRIMVRNLEPVPASADAVWEATAPVLIADGAEPNSKYFTFQEGGVKTVSLRFVSGVCSSEKVSINRTIYPLPYSVTAPPRCGPGPVTLSFVGDFPDGQTFHIYTSPSEGPIGAVSEPPYTYTTSSLTASTALYVKVGGGVSCSLSEEFTIVPITIFSLPEPARNVTPSPLGCGTNTVKIDAELVPGGGHDMFLFETETSLLPLSVNKSNFRQYFQFIISDLTAPATYYLETRDTLTGCKSAQRQAVELKTMPIPDPPIAPLSVSICGKGKAKITAQMGNVSGMGIRLYTTCGVQYGIPYIGDNAIAFADSPPFELETPEVSVSTTFYLHAWNPAEGMICPGGSCPPCFSACTPVVVQVNEIPNLPRGPEKVERCGVGSLVIQPQMPFSGVGVRLFDRPSGGQPLSEATELPFSLATPTLTRTATFYLETFGLNSGCVSVGRFPVIASVHAIPLAPEAQDVVRCGPGALTLTIRNRDASPQQLQLYTSPRAEEPLATSLQALWEYRADVTASVTFYLRAQNAAGCQSDSVAVALIINPMPAIPSISVNNPDNSPVVFWAKVPGAEFYDLRYKKKEDTEWQPEIMVTDTFHRFNDLEEGEYWVEVRSVCGDFASDWSAQQSFLIKVTALQESNTLDSRVLAYPNPTQGRVTLQLPEPYVGRALSVALLNSEGKKCWGQTWSAFALTHNSVMLDFPSLPSGLYVLAITLGNHTQYLKLTIHK